MRTQYLMMLLILAGTASAVRGEPYPTQFETRVVRRYADLPRSQNGHWYSRIVDTKKGVIETWDTYFVIGPNNQVSAQRTKLLQEEIPANYKPGDLYAALPPAEGGSWYSQSEENGEIQTWQNYYQIDNYGIRTKRQRILIQEPVPQKIEVVPPAPPKVESTEIKIVPKHEESEPKKRGRKLLPPSQLGNAPLVGEGSADLEQIILPTLPGKISPKAVEVKEGPERLLKSIPELATRVDWSVGSKDLSGKERVKLVQLLKSTEAESSRWQFDLSKRFLTCSEGKCLVRDRGKGNIEVPFQVGLGRVWLLSIESERLAYALEAGELDASGESSEILQLIRRMESMEAHLRYSHGNSKSNYVKKIEENLESLQQTGKKWNAFKNSERKDWVLRWQVLAKDAQAFVERARSLRKTEGLPGEVEETARRLESFLSELGHSPWESKREEQYEEARKLYFDVTAPFRDSYREYARFADTLRERPQEYIDMLVLMGAAENLAVYSWTIMEELAASEENP